RICQPSTHGRWKIIELMYPNGALVERRASHLPSVKHRHLLGAPNWIELNGAHTCLRKIVTRLAHSLITAYDGVCRRASRQVSEGASLQTVFAAAAPTHFRTARADSRLGFCRPNAESDTDCGWVLSQTAAVTRRAGADRSGSPCRGSRPIPPRSAPPAPDTGSPRSAPLRFPKRPAAPRIAGSPRSAHHGRSPVRAQRFGPASAIRRRTDRRSRAPCSNSTECDC